MLRTQACDLKSDALGFVWIIHTFFVCGKWGILLRNAFPVDTVIFTKATRIGEFDKDAGYQVNR